jgi:hypothetical protein
MVCYKRSWNNRYHDVSRITYHVSPITSAGCRVQSAESPMRANSSFTTHHSPTHNSIIRDSDLLNPSTSLTHTHHNNHDIKLHGALPFDSVHHSHLLDILVSPNFGHVSMKEGGVHVGELWSSAVSPVKQSSRYTHTHITLCSV